MFEAHLIKVVTHPLQTPEKLNLKNEKRDDSSCTESAEEDDC